LLPPRNNLTPVPQGLRDKISATLSTRFNVSIDIAPKSIPDTIRQYGKLCMEPGNEIINASLLVKAGERNCDASL